MKPLIRLCVLPLLCLSAGPLFGAATAYRNLVLGDGATAYWQFDEISGTTATDAAGGDNNGTYMGGVTLNQTSAYPMLNGAAGFDGASGRVQIPDAATFDLGAGAFTLEMWARTTTAARGDLFTYKGVGGDFGLHSNSQAIPGGFTGGISEYLNGFGSPNVVGANIDVWHHLVLTRNGAGALTLYIDGAATALGTDTDTLNIANDLLIGSNHSGSPGTIAIPFLGQIDEVAWYPLALSQSQINAHIATAAIPEPNAALLASFAGLVGVFARRRRTR